MAASTDRARVGTVPDAVRGRRPGNVDGAVRERDGRWTRGLLCEQILLLVVSPRGCDIAGCLVCLRVRDRHARRLLRRHRACSRRKFQAGHGVVNGHDQRNVPLRLGHGQNRRLVRVEHELVVVAVVPAKALVATVFFMQRGLDDAGHCVGVNVLTNSGQFVAGDGLFYGNLGPFVVAVDEQGKGFQN